MKNIHFVIVINITQFDNESQLKNFQNKNRDLALMSHQTNERVSERETTKKKMKM